jgi:hypothetical protein
MVKFPCGWIELAVMVMLYSVVETSDETLVKMNYELRLRGSRYHEVPG